MSFVPTIPLQLPEDDFAELMRLADRLGADPRQLAVDALRDFLSDHGAAETALDRLQNPEPAIALEDMKRRLSS